MLPLTPIPMLNVTLLYFHIQCARVESTSVYNGIGIVKLMGRDAGFIAAHAAISSCDVDMCMIPEVCLLQCVQTAQHTPSGSVNPEVNTALHRICI